LRDLLAVVAERQASLPIRKDLARARFVVAYIEQVPYMMKIAWTGGQRPAQNRPCCASWRWSSRTGWRATMSFPTASGVIGLLDDAYCSLSSLQAVSDHYRLQTGKHLFPDDLSQANRAMRRIIAEPYAPELDRIVIRTMKETGLLEAVTALANEENGCAWNPTAPSGATAGRIDIAALARLGIARGLITIPQRPGGVRFSQPLAVTSTLSSMRIPPRRQRGDPLPVDHRRIPLAANGSAASR
jgi:hypothetical protein